MCQRRVEEKIPIATWNHLDIVTLVPLLLFGLAFLVGGRLLLRAGLHIKLWLLLGLGHYPGFGFPSDFVASE